MSRWVPPFRNALEISIFPPDMGNLFRKYGIVERASYTNPQVMLPIVGPVIWAKKLNERIIKQDIDLLILNPHFYFQGFTSDLLDRLNPNPVRLLMAGDANLYFEQAALLAAKCDLVLCQDFTLNLQFRNLGLNSEIFVDISGSTHLKPLKTEATFDVGFIGFVGKEGRQRYIEDIKKLLPNRSFRVYDSEASGLLDLRNLNKFYCDVKILLHFSRSYLPRFPLAHQSGQYAACQAYAFKGRPIDAAFAGTACIAESCTSTEYQYPEMLTFRSPREAAALIEELLQDPQRLASYRERFCAKTVSRFDVLSQLTTIKKSLSELNSRHKDGSRILLRQRISRHYLTQSAGYRMAKASTLRALYGECQNLCQAPGMTASQRLIMPFTALFAALREVVVRSLKVQLRSQNHAMFRLMREEMRNRVDVNQSLLTSITYSVARRVKS